MLQNFAYYAQFMLHMLNIMLYEFNILFLLSYLNYKINCISSLSSFSTVQHTINNSSMYVYKHFKFIFVAFVTLVNIHNYFDNIITTDLPSLIVLRKVCILCKFCQLCWQYLPIILALSSMLLPLYYAQNYVGITG